MERAISLEDKFEAAYKILRQSPPISQDRMLVFYAYYKQALFGDFQPTEENEMSNYIQTFKNNAWLQVKGLNSDAAKEKYVKDTLELIHEEYKD